MARLRTGLDRLEAKRGGADGGPAVVFLCDAFTGDPGAALLSGGGGPVREPGEAIAAFLARAAPMASAAICLPDNGRG